MSMTPWSLRDNLVEFMETFDPDFYPGEVVKDLIVVFADIERAGAAGKVRTARRAEKIGVHEREGHRRAGTWLASVTHEPVGQAASELETAKAIETNPAISEAFGKGRISQARAREISAAAEVRPDLVGELLEEAEDLEFSKLKKHCEDIRLASNTVEEDVARYEQLRKKRYCRIWKDAEGAGRLEARLTPDALAVVRAGLGHFEKEIFASARRDGHYEKSHAYMADALVEMARASVSGGSVPVSDSEAEMPESEGSRKDGNFRSLVRVRVDLAALKRGHAVVGETCSIPGFGPVPAGGTRDPR
jgi:hypothetical protein